MIEDILDYKLSTALEIFVGAAERRGRLVYCNYVGRYTYRVSYPAVYVGSLKDFFTDPDVRSECDSINQKWGADL